VALPTSDACLSRHGTGLCKDNQGSFVSAWPSIMGWMCLLNLDDDVAMLNVMAVLTRINKSICN
jgi:hypothetical protein